MTSRAGISTAVMLAGGVGQRDATPEQAPLFADREDDPSVPALPLPSAPPQRARAGRPPGARNRSTAEWRELFLAKFRSPLMGLGEIYTMPTAKLAEELGLYKTVDVIEIDPDTGKARRTSCEDRSLLDIERAFRIQQEARLAALPYVHQKQPLAIEPKGNGDGLGMLVLGVFQSHAVNDDRGLPLADDPQVVDVSPSVPDGDAT